MVTMFRNRVRLNDHEIAEKLLIMFLYEPRDTDFVELGIYP